MRVLPAASTKLPPKLTVPPPEKVRAEVPTALLMIVWLAAVPAVVGYNYFSNRVRLSASQMDDFAMEFLNIAERNFT